MLKINTLASAIGLSSLVLTAQADGILEGRILDANTQNPVNGVLVSIKQLNRDVLVSHKGAFRIPKLKAGTYDITATLGEQKIHQGQVTITDDQVTTSNISVNTQEVPMEEILVVGQVAQMQRALDRQRHADNMISAINADAIGQLPDNNAAEALQRIPGISIERDQGEGRFVRVRGISPDLNSVTINGTQIPAPEAGRRAVALDVIPSDLISSMEVTKALTPDMDANAIGGSIEVKSVSALDREGAFYSFGGDLSFAQHTGETSPAVSASGGNTWEFINGHRLGVAGALTYENRKFGSDNIETGAKWDGSDLEEVAQRDYTLERERIGAALNIDYELDLNNSIYLRSLYSEFSDDEQRIQNSVEFIDAISEGDTGDAEVVRDLKDRKEIQTILSTTLGAEHFIEDWTIEYAIGYSKANEDEPGGISGADFEASADISGMGFNNSRRPNLIVSDDFLNASNFQLTEVESEKGLTEDAQTSLKFDITKDLYFNDNPAMLKFGAKSTQRTKDQQLDVTIYENFNTADLTLDNFSNGQVDYELGEFGPSIDGDLVRQAIDYSTGELDIEESSVGDFQIDEDITAAYIMGRVDLNNTRILAGVRYEGTEQSLSGFKYDDTDESITAQNSKNNYSHILPSLHIRHELNDDTQLRLAYSNAVVRPTFDQLSPGFTTDGEEGEKGNTQLEALESTNYDVGIEHFTGDAGVISGFIFHKNIKNFVFETDIAGTIGFEDFDNVTTYRNGDKATLTGLELAYSQKLSMLPEPFNNFLLSANMAYSESDADIGSRSIALPNQSDVTGNLIFGYQQNRLMMRLAANYKSKYLLEVNDLVDLSEDVYQAAQTQWDFSAAYGITDSLKVKFEIANLTDEPYYTYQNNKDLNAQYEEYGPTYRLGFSYTNF
jgi:TonB-dependent receptor